MVSLLSRPWLVDWAIVVLLPWCLEAAGERTPDPRPDADIRAKMSLALMGIVLLGVVLVMAIMLGARSVRRVARRPTRPSRLGSDDWASKPLVDHGPDNPEEPTEGAEPNADDR